MADKVHGPFLTSLIGGLKQINNKHGKVSISQIRGLTSLTGAMKF